MGAHPSGQIGEDPLGIPNNLMPFVSQVAIGKRAELVVFGDDYETPDGTGVRDYIHIMDLADGHVAALDRVLGKNPLVGFVAINLGTGRGNSVLEVVTAFEKASGKKIKYKIAERRPGDIATSYADPKLAKELLGWTAKRDLLDMCKYYLHFNLIPKKTIVCVFLQAETIGTGKQAILMDSIQRNISDNQKGTRFYLNNVVVTSVYKVPIKFLLLY